MTFPLPHALRLGEPGDRAFVQRSWLCEHRFAPSTRFVENAQYFADQHALIDDLLETSITLVACGADDPAHIYGFAVYGPGDVVHYVYVKSAYRRLGLADVLLAAAFPGRTRDRALYATHAGRMWGEIEPGARKGQPAQAGALTRRGIYYRPHLLVIQLPRAS